jgi:maltose O-acetyltransferase
MYVLENVVHLALKLFHLIQEDITRFLDLVNRCLGFGFVVRYLFFLGNAGINARVLRHFGATVGKNARINSPLIIFNAAGDFRNLSIGDNCHIGADVFLDLANPVTIGNNVTISMRSSIITHFDVGDSRLKESGYGRKDGKVSLGDDVYLGCSVSVLHGVTIGRGVLVGANSLVINDVPPHSIAVGMPAKIIKTLHEEP